MQQDYGPRFGEDPPPGHWAASIGGFAGMAYLAHGLDCLAAEAGLADGLSALLAGCGVAAGDAGTAEPWQIREWYYRCYAKYAGEPPAGGQDVVAVGRGITGFNSGWSGLYRGSVAGRRTDEYVMSILARGCSVLR